jgi:hypothetical protein
MGTPDYIAPEQATNSRKADVRADIYSLGCTLYCLLAGKPPFPGETAMQKILAHIEQQAQPLTEVRKDVPPELATVVQRMMAKDPAKRFQTPKEVAQALSPFIQPANKAKPAEQAAASQAGQPVLPVPATATPESKRSLLQRRWFQVATATAMVLVVGIVVAQVAFKGNTSPTKTTHDDEDKADQAVGEVRVFEGHTDAVNSLAVSPDGQLVLSGGSDRKNLRLWDYKTGKELMTFDGDPAPIYSVAFSPKGDLALSGGQARMARLWDAKTGKEVPRMANKGMVEVNGVAFSPDGRWAATAHGVHGAGDTVARLWDVANGEVISTFRHPTIVWRVAFASKSRLLTGCGSPGNHPDLSLRMWDLATGKELARMEHPWAVLSIAATQDGKQALTGSDKAIRLWDLEKEKAVRLFEGHTGPVRSVVLSP